MSMNLPSRFFPIALVLASVAAQTPGGAGEPAPRSEIALQSLQSLTIETVFQRQPLAATQEPEKDAGGTAAYQPFARIRDAQFTRDGRLVELHVETAGAADGQPPLRRVLPAKAVRWDEASKRWLTVEPNLAFAGLDEVSKPSKEAAVRKENQLLASELMLATAGVSGHADEAAVEASEAKTKKTAPVLWFVPAEQTIAFAVMPHGSKLVPLPWSLVQIKEQGGRLQLLIDTNAARLDDAPTCKDASQQPSAELRQRCYQHYGVPAPKWERKLDSEKDRKDPPKKGGSKPDDR
jgi:hypothetical protein